MSEQRLKTLYYGHINNELYVKSLFINAQNRYKWVKDELESTFKDRINFPPADPLALEYKEVLKDIKKDEEKLMKHLDKELEHVREGLNPPYCYLNYNGNRRTE